MNGAKIALRIPMKINRLLSLWKMNGKGIISRVVIKKEPYPSINATRFFDFKNTFRTRPCSSNRYSIRQNLKFHSRAWVSTFPFPASSVTKRFKDCGKGTRKSSNSLLNRAIR